MIATANLPQTLPFMHPVVFFPAIVFFLTFIDLLGWTFHIGILTSGIPHFSTMKPNTALALGLLAACCRSRIIRVDGRRGCLTGIARLGLGTAMMLSCGTLFEYASGRSLGIDSLILGVPLDRFGDPAGRMALGTAFCITLTGTALGLLDRAPRFSVLALLTANVITVAALVGFVLNRGPLLNVIWLRSLSLPTAVCLVMLAVATLTARPERGPISFLFSSNMTARKRVWLILGGFVLALLVALPSVVGMRVGIPEAFMTLLGLAVLLYSAQVWFHYMDNAQALRAQMDDVQ